jgi:hypothetical protein
VGGVNSLWTVQLAGPTPLRVRQLKGWAHDRWGVERWGRRGVGWGVGACWILQLADRTLLGPPPGLPRPIPRPLIHVWLCGCGYFVWSGRGQGGDLGRQAFVRLRGVQRSMDLDSLGLYAPYSTPKL